MAQTMDKRIPVSEERWKELGKIKGAGQTYDHLIGELLKSYNRKSLALRAKEAKVGKGNWTRLEDI